MRWFFMCGLIMIKLSLWVSNRFINEGRWWSQNLGGQFRVEISSV